MIVLTRLNGSRFGINDEQIERIEDGANTVVVLVNGNRYTALESLDDIIDIIVDFRARVLDAASVGEVNQAKAQRDASIALFRPHSILNAEMKAVDVNDKGDTVKPASLLDSFRPSRNKDQS